MDSILLLKRFRKSFQALRLRLAKRHASAPEAEAAEAAGAQTRFLDWTLALALATISCALYVVTLAPGLLESDSAEFQTLAVKLGYAHPAGYPVYLLAAHLFTWLPLGDVAYRVNLCSAFCAAVAVGLLYLLARAMTGSRWTAIAAAVALAVAPTFWSLAIIARAYTLGLALMIAVLLCLWTWRQRGHWAWLFSAACLGGISTGVHVTHSLMAPAALLFVAFSRTPAPHRSAKWPAMLAGAFVGLALTLAAYAVIDHGDQQTSYFSTVISPSQSLWNLSEGQLHSFWGRVALCLHPPQYVGLIGRKPFAESVAKLAWYQWNLTNEFPWPWLVLAVLGVYGLVRRDAAFALLLLWTFAAHLAFDLIYDMGGINVLYPATYIPIVLFGAAGLRYAAFWSAAIYRRFQAALRPRKSGQRPQSGDKSPHSKLAFVVIAILLAPLAWPSNWTTERRRKCEVPPGEDPFWVNYAPTSKEPMADYHQRVRELVHDLEPGAVLFTGWCLLYPDYYVSRIEMDRPDLVFVQDYPQADHFELADSAVEYAEEMSAAGRAVYFTHIVGKIAAKYELKPIRRGRDELYRMGRKKKVAVRFAQVSGTLRVPPAKVSGTLRVPLAKVSGTLRVPLAKVSGTLRVPLAKVSGTLRVPLAKVSGTLRVPLCQRHSESAGYLSVPDTFGKKINSPGRP